MPMPAKLSTSKASNLFESIRRAGKEAYVNGAAGLSVRLLRRRSGLQPPQATAVSTL